MVLTVEPGLYVKPADDVPEHFWHLGIRLEDDAIVTATGLNLLPMGGMTLSLDGEKVDPIPYMAERGVVIA